MKFFSITPKHYHRMCSDLILIKVQKIPLRLNQLLKGLAGISIILERPSLQPKVKPIIEGACGGN